MAVPIGGSMFPITEKLGSWEAVLQAISAQWGRPPSRELQSRWRKNGKIVGTAIGALKARCEALQIEVVESDFVSTVGPVDPLPLYSAAAKARKPTRTKAERLGRTT